MGYVNPIKHDDGTRDRRYRIGPEWIGYERPQYVVRFCDEWVGARESFADALQVALRHQAARRIRIANVEGEPV